MDVDDDLGVQADEGGLGVLVFEFLLVERLLEDAPPEDVEGEELVRSDALARVLSSLGRLGEVRSE